MCNVFSTCLTISVEAGIYFLTASFYWLLNRNIAGQVARGICYIVLYARKYIDALWQSLRKVKPDSISCTASRNKNVA